MLKKIKGYERYYISDKGKVYNENGKEISQRKATNGYMRVNVRKGDIKYEKPKTFSVHRLVAEAFLPKIDGKECVNHKDGNKTNNNAENLEWCTHKENSIHAYNTNDKYKQFCLNNIKKTYEQNKKMVKVFYNGQYLGIYKGIEETAKKFNVNKKTIYNNSKGMTNRKGYTFFIVEGGDVSA